MGLRGSLVGCVEFAPFPFPAFVPMKKLLTIGRLDSLCPTLMPKIGASLYDITANKGRKLKGNMTKGMKALTEMSESDFIEFLERVLRSRKKAVKQRALSASNALRLHQHTFLDPKQRN